MYEKKINHFIFNFKRFLFLILNCHFGNYDENRELSYEKPFSNAYTTINSTEVPSCYVDEIINGTVYGWFYDPYSPYGGANIHIYVDNTPEKGGKLIATGITNVYRPDVNSSLNIPYGNHGFETSLPDQYKKDYRGLVFYGISKSGKVVMLNNSPLTTMGTHLLSSTIPTGRNDITTWTNLHTSFKERAKSKADVVFFGDSITFLMSVDKSELTVNNQTVVNYFGKKYWDIYFSNANVVNFGIGGDQTQNILYRILDGELTENLSPEVIVLLIGTNNISDKTANEAKEGILSLVRLIKALTPKTKIILLPLLPRGRLFLTLWPQIAVYEDVKDKITEVNNYIKTLVDNQTVFTIDNIDDSFRNSDKSLNIWLYATDCYEYVTTFYLIHPNESGYSILLKAIYEKINEIAPEVFE